VIAHDYRLTEVQNALAAIMERLTAIERHLGLAGPGVKPAASGDQPAPGGKPAAEDKPESPDDKPASGE
jgi:hypothetical protein